MNKVNLCWVISDGRKGHEIQSMTVATALAKEVNLYRFQSTLIQKMTAPLALAHKIQKTPWNDNRPNISESPALIISCGRQAAAAAKVLKQETGAKHIHILNPKGNLSDYDVLLLPKHDEVYGDNVCHFTGSIHNIKQVIQNSPKGLCHGCIAVMLGNPCNNYWTNQWPNDWQRIKLLNRKIFICGSPRLSDSAKLIIKKRIQCQNTTVWLGNEDGVNPYLEMISNADHFFVTADSINMMNECMATGKPVDLIGKQFVSSKRHNNYINSIVDFNSTNKSGSANNRWPDPIEEITNNPKLQNLLKSPSSFNKG